MGTNKFEQWIAMNDRQTCFKLTQHYYIAKESGKKFKIIKKRILLLLLRRFFFLFMNLFRISKTAAQDSGPTKTPLMERILGLDKFAVKGLLSAQPVIKDLHFKAEEAPLVSIIIAVYNHFDYTYNCLLSILEQTKDVSYEIILVNDCSSDGTAGYVEKIHQIVYIENSENLGFLRSCNKAALLAKGKYLCFLNNDTQVTAGWLNHMLSVFHTDKNTGLVGAKLVFPYGLLQEAGGLVDYTGQPANYGRYGDPEDIRHNVLRETDYCSGACILVLKEDFESFEGFDKRYIPAYYEDTDLAFAIRYHLNKKVYYQPLTEIIHFEGISSGKTIVAGSVKEYQLINSKKFIEKWSPVIKEFPKTTVYEEIAAKFR